MKSIKTTLAALLLTAAIMHCVSCKKESTTPTPTPKSAQEKLLGKWNIISEVYNDYYGGSSHITTYNFPAGDYVDFKSDGRWSLRLGWSSQIWTRPNLRLQPAKVRRSCSTAAQPMRQPHSRRRQVARFAVLSISSVPVKRQNLRWRLPSRAR